jgi:hypothetical protein
MSGGVAGEAGRPVPLCRFQAKSLSTNGTDDKETPPNSVEVFSLPVVKELEISVRNVRRNA